jgi:hypothetical protein
VKHTPYGYLRRELVEIHKLLPAFLKMKLEKRKKTVKINYKARKLLSFCSENKVEVQAVMTFLLTLHSNPT